MNEKEAETLAQIAEIQKMIEPLTRGRLHLACAMAFTMAAAHHVLHDGGEEEDFMVIARALWERSREIHHRMCS